MGILFWILVILWFITTVFGLAGIYAVYATNGLLLVLFILLGWKVFGPPLQ